MRESLQAGGFPVLYGGDCAVLLGAVPALRDVVGAAARAATRLAGHASGWWFHVDVDVLDGQEFTACGAASDPSMPEGLTWAGLTALTRTALQTGGCRGWSIGVYNPALDPENREAQRIVAYLVDVLGPGGRTGSAP